MGRQTDKHGTKEQKKAALVRRVARRRALIILAKQVPCADCGGRFPTPAMQFDHVRGVKSFNIGSLPGRYSPTMDQVMDEIAKCEVVCANCHAVRTYEGTVRP